MAGSLWSRRGCWGLLEIEKRCTVRDAFKDSIMEQRLKIEEDLYERLPKEGVKRRKVPC